MKMNKMTNAQDKIQFIMYHIDGNAQQWRDNKIAEYDAETTKYADYNTFVKELKEDWGQVDEPGLAMHRLLTWRKLPKQSINQYIMRVDQDLNLAKVTDDTTKCHLLVLGLPNTLREKLWLGGAPTTYKSLQTHILDIEVVNTLFSTLAKLKTLTTKWKSTKLCWN